MLTNRLASAQLQLISGRKQRYIAMTAKLDAMSPLKVLTRGYAMVQGGEGEVLRSVDQVQPGDKIKISVSDGEIEAAVTNVKENSHE